MKTAHQSTITVDEFLAWAQDQERGRFELVGGEIVMQQSERISHVRAKGNVYVALRNAIAAARLDCAALTDGATVRISDDTAFEPDALVYCGSALPDSGLEVPNPIVIVEVISASTAAQDMGYKRRGYFSLDSVQHYLVVDPERRLVLHYSRGEGHEQFPRLVSEGALALDPPGLELKVSELFT